MNNTITLPANYDALSCEEMTYTEGGANVVEAIMAWFPLYGWFKGVSAVRDYRNENINSNWVENGLSYFVSDTQSSFQNAVYNVGCAFWFGASCFSVVGLLPNALIIFG